MATKKTTKSTTKAATKKTTAKKTTKTTAAKSRYDSQTYTLREVTNSSLRALLILIAAVAVCSFFVVPYGTLVDGAEAYGGWYVITQAIQSNYEGALITKYVLTNVIPVVLLFISAAMLLIRTDKFTAFMSIMVTGIAAVLFFVGYATKVLVATDLGWELSLLFIIVELLFSIALYVASPSYKKR